MAREQFWTEPLMLYAALLHKRRNGHFPTPTEWAMSTEDNPSYRTVIKTYHKWDVFLSAATEYEASLCVTV